MNSKIFEYQTKIKKILEYFLKGRCSKQFEVYLEEFLNFFWRQTNTGWCYFSNYIFTRLTKLF